METTTIKWINPSVLRWARERIGLSHEDVEKQIANAAKLKTCASLFARRKS